MGMLTAVVDTIEELDQKVDEYPKRVTLCIYFDQKRFAEHLLSSASGAMDETKKLINFITHPHTHSENIEYAKKTFTSTVGGAEAKYPLFSSYLDSP